METKINSLLESISDFLNAIIFICAWGFAIFVPLIIFGMVLNLFD